MSYQISLLENIEKHCKHLRAYGISIKDGTIIDFCNVALDDLERIMGKRDTVAGIERSCEGRAFTGIECDSCEKVFRKKVVEHSNTFRNYDIVYEAEKVGWETVCGHHYCPDCK